MVANFLDLASISTAGSAGFLLIFAAVNAANMRLARQTGSRRWVSAVGLAGCVGAFISILIEMGSSSPLKLVVLGVLVGVSFAVEAVYRRFRGRSIQPA